jgi:hypothetical protein
MPFRGSNIHLPKERTVIMGKKGSKTRKIGRDAGTGRFIPVKDAQRRKKTAVVETIKTKK